METRREVFRWAHPKIVSSNYWKIVSEIQFTKIKSTSWTEVAWWNAEILQRFSRSEIQFPLGKVWQRNVLLNKSKLWFNSNSSPIKIILNQRSNRVATIKQKKSEMRKSVLINKAYKRIMENKDKPLFQNISLSKSLAWDRTTKTPLRNRQQRVAFIQNHHLHPPNMINVRSIELTNRSPILNSVKVD